MVEPAFRKGVFDVSFAEQRKARWSVMADLQHRSPLVRAFRD
jgi:hypothetical protein